MGKKKGKKGQTQEPEGESSGSQQQVREEAPEQQPRTDQPRQEGATRPQKQKMQKPQQKPPSHEASPTHQYGHSAEPQDPPKGKGRGRGRQALQTEELAQVRPEQQGKPGRQVQTAPVQHQALPKREPHQVRSEQQHQVGPSHGETAPFQQQHKGQPRQDPQPIGQQQQGGPRGRGRPAPVQQQYRGPPRQDSQQTGQWPRGGPWGQGQTAPAQQQHSGQPRQDSQQTGQRPQGGPWGQGQTAPAQPQGGPWGQGQTAPVQQQGGQRQPVQQSIPAQQQHQGPQHGPPRQRAWGQQAQPGAPDEQIHQVQSRDIPQPESNIPQQPPSAIPQQVSSKPQLTEQVQTSQDKPEKRKGPQKGKKSSRQEEGPEPGASSSREPPTKEIAKLQLSEGGGGDAQYKPLESVIRATPGTKGRKILVETNHLRLNLGNLKRAVHYDVNLIPDKPKHYLRTVLELFQQKHYKDRYPAFDGRKNLYSAKMLPFNEFIEDNIVITEPDGREKQYKVEIKFANYVDLTPLHNLLNSVQTPMEAIQVVDIVLRSAPASTCVPVGRSFFVKPPSIIDLGEGMEMYTGFYQSAIRGWQPFLNVDVAHKAFPKNVNVTDVLSELFSSYYQEFKREDLSKSLDRGQIDTLTKYIKTLKISYEIPRHSSTRREYSVNGLGDPPNRAQFKLDSGEVITVEKYFEKYKNYKLRYPNLPSLWVGSKQRVTKILLPLELCTLLENQNIRRTMTEGQTSNMIKYAATSTTIRKDKIMRSLSQANHNSHPAVKEFGFSVGNQFETLEARVLQPPGLMYANPNKAVVPSKGVWRQNNDDKFLAGMTINKWTIACVDRRAPRQEDLTNLANMIYRNGIASGMNITAQAEKPFVHIRSASKLEIQKYFRQQKDKMYDVIFVIVPSSNNSPEYSYVKTAAEINVGCLTQCIKSKTLARMNAQTAINILLKVNSKLNGTNHCLAQQSRPRILFKPCMIMGADVTHPSPHAVTELPSVAAVTASHDPKAFKYNICWRLQPPKVEIIEDLEAIVVEQLNYFFQMNRGTKPETIVFFRDGVSEGQFAEVRNAEIRAIRSACKKVQREGYEPKITFLVVQKRHHTRLFPKNIKDSEDRNCNVPAGTCVDKTITHPFMQDFYLVSHASIQGVARPTKYCTLWDDNLMSNDDIEELTYFLCHMFTRCNRSVSYPAPTYYAHLAAARAKVYIENDTLNMERLQQEFARYEIREEIRKGKPMFFV